MQIGRIGIFLFFRPVGLLFPLGGGFFGDGFGRYWECQNGKRIFEKSRVGFGRTELSLRAIGTTFCALSSGRSQGSGFSRGFVKGCFLCFFRGGTGGSKLTKFEKYCCKNWGRIWSYRALVKCYLYNFLRSIIWDWSEGSGF